MPACHLCLSKHNPARKRLLEPLRLYRYYPNKHKKRSLETVKIYLIQITGDGCGSHSGTTIRRLDAHSRLVPPRVTKRRRMVSLGGGLSAARSARRRPLYLDVKYLLPVDGGAVA